jgi:hypothetical protein
MMGKSISKAAAIRAGTRTKGVLDPKGSVEIAPGVRIAKCIARLGKERKGGERREEGSKAILNELLSR